MNAAGCAASFMLCVSRREWTAALDYSQISWLYGFDPKSKPGPISRLVQTLFPATRVRQTNGAIELEELLGAIEITEVVGTGEVVHTSPVFAQVPVKFRRLMHRDGTARLVTSVVMATVVKESRPFTASENGGWGVNPVSALRVVRFDPHDKFDPVSVDTED